MGKKFFLTEAEKNSIRNLYNLNEQEYEEVEVGDDGEEKKVFKMGVRGVYRVLEQMLKDMHAGEDIHAGQVELAQLLHRNLGQIIHKIQGGPVGV